MKKQNTDKHWDYDEKWWDYFKPTLIRWATGSYSIGFPGERNMFSLLDSQTCPSLGWVMPLHPHVTIDLSTSSEEFFQMALPQTIDKEFPHYDTYFNNWWRVVEWGLIEPVPLEDLIAVFGPGDWYVTDEPRQVG